MELRTRAAPLALFLDHLRGQDRAFKGIVRAMFGTENALIRVDMSEYMEKHSVQNDWITARYVGYTKATAQREGQANPYSVILLMR